MESAETTSGLMTPFKECFEKEYPVGISKVWLGRVAESVGRAVNRCSLFCDLVCLLDSLLRWAFRIGEFSSDQNCLLRIAKVRWNQPVCLQDNTEISAGDWIGELHLWNDHLPKILRSQRSLATGASFRTRMTQSLRSLAVSAAIEPELQELVAFHAQLSSIGQPDRRDWESLARRYRCNVRFSRPSLPGRVHDVFGFFLTITLTWVFNPERRLVLGNKVHRIDMWISREALLRHFAPQGIEQPHGLVDHRRSTEGAP